MTEACYAIREDCDGDTQICAVFTTREAAEAALSLYKTCPDDNSFCIQELPLNPVIEPAPAGKKGYSVFLQKKTKDTKATYCSAARVQSCDELVIDDGSFLLTHVFAEGPTNALLIAYKRFIQFYDAQQAEPFPDGKTT